MTYKAFEVTFPRRSEHRSIYAGETAGQAKSSGVRAAQSAGFPWGFADVAAIRAPQFDDLAAATPKDQRCDALGWADYEYVTGRLIESYGCLDPA